MGYVATLHALGNLEQSATNLQNLPIELVLQTERELRVLVVRILADR